MTGCGDCGECEECFESDNITCENCGEVIERRYGEWTHGPPDGLYEQCWPNKNFYAIPSVDNESEEA